MALLAVAGQASAGRAPGATATGTGAAVGGGPGRGGSPGDAGVPPALPAGALADGALGGTPGAFVGRVVLGPKRADSGAGVAERFHLMRRFEVTLQVANAFATESQSAIARAEAAVAALPGVRRVVGPSRLLSLRVDAAGRVTAAPLFGTPAAGAPSLQGELDRRADALGWFVAPGGSVIRLLIDVDDRPPSAGALETAVAGAGLKTMAGEIPGAAVWPDPDRDRLPFEAEWPLRIALLSALPMVVASIAARARASRFAVGTVAMGLTMAAPGLAAPIGPIQTYAAVTGGAGFVLAWGAWLALRVRRRGGRASPLWLSASGAAKARRRSGGFRGARRAPLVIVLPASALVAAAVLVAPRLQLRSDLSRDTSLFFVHLRADMAEPVVLREVRRFVERLRSERGVSAAWSIADLFAAVPRAESGVGGIPDDREVALRILRQAAADPAVAAEVSPDFREALVPVRFEEESGLDPALVVERATELASRDLAHAIWRVDVTDATLAPGTRALGRGLLCEGGRARVIGLCERAGRTLGEEQRQAIDRTLRRVSLAPVVDPPAYAAALTREVAAFLEDVAMSEHRVTAPQASYRKKLVDAILGLPGEPSLDDLTRALSEQGWPRLPTPTRDARASELRRRVQLVRRHEITRVAAKEILADADLPTEGGLSDALRDATLEAMGPIVGVPAPPRSPGALPLEASVIGGAVEDRALAVAWSPRLRQGVVWVAIAGALLLLAVGGWRGLTWWPATLAPGAIVLLVPAVAGIPMGVLLVAVLAGALGGGALFGVTASAGGGRS